jgi:hypothetical protein
VTQSGKKARSGLPGDSIRHWHANTHYHFGKLVKFPIHIISARPTKLHLEIPHSGITSCRSNSIVYQSSQLQPAQ